MTREKWLEERKHGIGGSDAATVIGENPYKTNVELWEEKTNRKNAEDISDKPYVQYGIDMEPILRENFIIKHPEFEIVHKENEIIKHSKFPFLFATLDGQLINKDTGEMGILEIKTTNILQSMQKEKWKDQIPPNYYCQVLHYLNVTGYSFAFVFAELNYSEDYQSTRTYKIERKNVEEDIKYLLDKEIEFWKYVVDDIRPPLELPRI